MDDKKASKRFWKQIELPDHLRDTYIITRKASFLDWYHFIVDYGVSVPGESKE